MAGCDFEALELVAGDAVDFVKEAAFEFECVEDGLEGR